ncbi:2'-5' RNA ligase family protein [uncultured Ruegeria sp.]|uniref:2'-5' RNA ligase family protein n=1 Tax=uncultured Ruegeria sp. TaxID=259304 RepID=UPI0026016ACE|nr:2'-5' RNA ligase family protein [uncultured Ruegeria sp.]
MKADVATYSVWMVPEEPQLTDLSTRIKSFAHAHNAPTFLPHVTLMGDLAGDEAELVTILSRISAGFSGHSLTVKGIGAEDLFYKSLYLDLSPTPDLVSKQETLANVLPVSQCPREFLPHISVAYGPIAPEIKTAEAKVLKSLIGTQLCFRHLHLVQSSQNVPIENWKILKSFEL